MGAFKFSILISLIIILPISAYFIFRKKDTIVCSNQEDINNFLKKWIKTDGVVKILSRNLSWVNDEIMGILQAKGADLYLYVESENEVVKNIMQINKDCKVFLYGKYGFEPNSRYTVIHANKDDRQIAIALQERKNQYKLYHEIYCSKEGAYDKKMLGLAMDLMNCIEKMEKKFE